jgi:hypothetical protein
MELGEKLSGYSIVLYSWKMSLINVKAMAYGHIIGFSLVYVRICCIGIVGLHHLFYKGVAGPLGLPPPLAAAPWPPVH